MSQHRKAMTKAGISSLAMLASLLLSTHLAKATPVDEDYLRVTAICDEAKSSTTALELFAYSNKYFARYKTVKPLKDQVSVGKLYDDDGPDAEFHDATFDTFHAKFILEPNGYRNLFSIATRSSAFKLPRGLKFGQSMDQVRKILGPPSAVSSTSLLYQTGGEALSDVFFNFEGGKLVEVSWNYGWGD